MTAIKYEGAVMLFKKRKIRLSGADADKYTRFFVDQTHMMGKDIIARSPYTIQIVADEDPLAWLDVVSTWHQAIVREQLVMMSVMFYGGDAVEEDVLSLLKDIEHERSKRGFMRQDVDKYLERVDKVSNNLLKADGDTRYFDALITLITPILHDDLQLQHYVEHLAEQLRMQHIAFWKKHGYCD